MTDIFINIQQIESANQGLQHTLLELSEVENNIALIHRGIPMDIRGRCGINGQLSRLIRGASAMRRQMKWLLRVAKTGIDAYRSAEYRLLYGIPSEK